MEPFDLIDESLAAALGHVERLRSTLRTAEQTDSCWEDCHRQMHELIADIISCRNAAELLRRSLLSRQSEVPIRASDPR